MRGQPRPGPGQNGAQATGGGSAATRMGASMDLVATPAIKPELSLVVGGGQSAGWASGGSLAASSGRVVVASNAQRIQFCCAVADVTCSQDGRVEWVTCSHCHVTALAGTPSFTALALQDGSLQLLTRAGRRKLPPLALAAAVVLLTADGDKLAALLANGSVKVWDVERGKVCRPCLGVGPSICSLLALVAGHTSQDWNKLSTCHPCLAPLHPAYPSFLSSCAHAVWGVGLCSPVTCCSLKLACYVLDVPPPDNVARLVCSAVLLAVQDGTWAPGRPPMLSSTVARSAV
jgi:hypothetical protein